MSQLPLPLDFPGYPWEIDRVVCWFSCGAASAVAAKLTIERFAGRLPVVVALCASTLSTEHPDNERFIQDCEAWFGQPVVRLYAEDYVDTWDVYERTGWLVGPLGARCTVELKKSVRHAFQRVANDLQVFGFDSTEAARAARHSASEPETACAYPLLDAGIDKQGCLNMIAAAGIAIPAMYRLGYGNNNCIGCVKGGAGYWNKIRQDFPEVFARMAATERRMGVRICRVTRGGERVRVYLDELLPSDGRRVEPMSCGVICEMPPEAP